MAVSSYDVLVNFAIDQFKGKEIHFGIIRDGASEKGTLPVAPALPNEIMKIIKAHEYQPKIIDIIKRLYDISVSDLLWIPISTSILKIVSILLYQGGITRFDSWYQNWYNANVENMQPICCIGLEDVLSQEQLQAAAVYDELKLDAIYNLETSLHYQKFTQQLWDQSNSMVLQYPLAMYQYALMIDGKLKLAQRNHKLTQRNKELLMCQKVLHDSI